jgi:hypothetical protein
MSQYVDRRHASGEELATYAMDETQVDAAVARHIAECAVCAAELHALQEILQHASASLYRLDCPPTDELEAYALAQLASSREAEIAGHLAVCTRCAADVAVINEVFPAAAAAPAAAAPGSMQQTVRRILATLLPVPAPLEPAIALRGDTETYVAEDIELTLGRDVDRGRFSLYGKILGHAAAGADEQSRPPSALSVRLLKITGAESDAQPTLVAETPVERQYFEFNGVFPGQYQLEVLLPDRLIVVASLVL